ncbi:MAG: hypothetical protein A3J51_03785 [Omnitrophica WOR_2 bacterium RIFCSPHIGHO2_02_FULL_45_21]|nr:MAG: hypothetical protein A3J51_03785 [Omnitrophica WOR_2 bacterium RIFCSPHIGHO2_02_FULL_45_21]
MAAYIYRARDEKGKLIKGAMEALSPDELTAKLHKMGYLATSVSELKPGMRIKGLTERWRPVKQQDLLVFNFQLANLIEAGVPILSALKSIEAQIENKKLKDIIGDIERNIEAGSSLSGSLNYYPGIFSKLFSGMVKSGEESGRLDRVLRRYAIFSESQMELAEKIKGALFYPAILFIASILVILFIITYIIPQFVDLFTKAGIRLPLATQILYTVGLSIKNYWYAIIAALAVLLWGVKRYWQTQKGKYQSDRLLLKIPFFAILARRIYISRFTRTLSTLLSAGVPVLHSLDITKEVIGNALIADEIARVRQSVERGEKLADSLKVSGEFPPDTVQMVAVGEEGGNLDEMLNKIADFYDMAVGYAVKRLTVIIEPLFLAIMAAIIGLIMASILIPIFDMVKILRH